MKKFTAALSAIIILPIFFVVIFVGGGNCLPDPAHADTGPTKTVDPEDLPVDQVGPWSGEQLVIAAIIMNAAKDGGLSMRAQIIGVMAGMGESTLTNVGHGDSAGPDSRGVFQQRAKGWGTEAQRMDPYTAATGFYGTGDHASAPGLIDIDGWETMPMTRAINAVQRNADPNHYARFEDDARDVVAALGEVELAPDQPRNSGNARAGSKVNLHPNTKPHVVAAAEVIANEFGVTDMGGWRVGNSRDPNGHPSGLALDVMVPLTPEGKALGDDISQFVIDNADEMNVLYVIWYQRIWHVNRADEGWRQMEDRGSPTQNHLDHPHISFVADPTGDPTNAGGSGGSAAPVCDTAQADVPTDGRKPAGPWGGHDNGRIPESALAEIPWAPGQFLRADATQSLIAMNNDFKQEFGTDMGITDAYRSYEEQVSIKRRKGRMAATPGTSNHGWALAVDFGTGINRFGTPQHEWMRANAGRYGWVHPDWAQQGGSLEEAWHWEYWGLDA